jgi:hypothetical protein
MKRKLKFRAWDKGHNKMSYKVNLYSMNSKGVIDKAQIEMKQVMSHIGFHCEVMQYVGNIRGVELWEGDIVKWEDYSGSKGTGEIIYNNEFGKFEVKDIIGFKYGDKSIGYSCYDIPPIHTFEIIGNIYQNPELIKK